MGLVFALADGGMRWADRVLQMKVKGQEVNAGAWWGRAASAHENLHISG